MKKSTNCSSPLARRQPRTASSSRATRTASSVARRNMPRVVSDGDAMARRRARSSSDPDGASDQPPPLRPCGAREPRSSLRHRACGHCIHSALAVRRGSPHPSEAPPPIPVCHEGKKYISIVLCRSPRGGNHGRLAGIAVGGLEGHARHPSPLHANHRQGPAGAGADDEPLVAGGAVPHGRGLTTSPIPHGGRLQIDFDFIDHDSHPHQRRPRAAARPEPPPGGRVLPGRDGHAALARHRRGHQRDAPARFPTTAPPSARTGTTPRTMPIRRTAAWLCAGQADRVLEEFRSRFTGKCSPVHFFWGGFDLAVTRFSGRPAPERPGAGRGDARGLLAMRSSAPASGPGRSSSEGRPSTATPLRSRRASPPRTSTRAPPGTTRASRSTS